MAQLESSKPALGALGVSLVLIAAERRGGLTSPEGFLEKNPIAFPLLLDEDRAVTKAYGVYHAVGLDAFNIAHPATFIIDQSGIIRFIYVGSSQTDRAPAELILKKLKGLRSPERRRVG